MRSKYQFNSAERFAIWEVFHGQCFWCGKPLEFPQTTVDHVVAESLLDDPEELERIKTMYGLPQTFNINGFANWVPAHSNCNSSKGKQLFTASPAMVAILHDIAKRAPKAQVVCEKVLADKKKGKILAQIEVAVEKGVITESDIRELFDGIEPLPGATSISNATVRLHILPHWQIVRSEGRLTFVTDGQRIGMTSAEANPDPSWLCPNCLQYGPWNGVICMTCGMRSAPD